MCRRSTQSLHTRARNTADFSSKLPARTKRRRAVAAGFAHCGPSRHLASPLPRVPRAGVLGTRGALESVSRGRVFPLTRVSPLTHHARVPERSFLPLSPSPTDNERSFLLFSRLCLIFSRVLAPNLAPVALKLGSGASFGALFISACSAPPEILSSRSSRRASRARRACSSSPTRCRTTRRA